MPKPPGSYHNTLQPAAAPQFPVPPTPARTLGVAPPGGERLTAPLMTPEPRVIPSPAVLTREFVERRMGGLTPYVDMLGEDQSEALYLEAMRSAEARFERELGLRLAATRIATNPGLITANGLQPGPLVYGVDYDEEEDPQDWISGQMSKQILPSWRTRRRPILSVQRVCLAFGPTYLVLDIPHQWIKIYHRMGKIAILPVGTEAAIAQSQGIWFMPLIDASWPWNVVPQFVSINYTAGFPSDDTGVEGTMAKEFYEMKMQLGFAAANEVIESVRHLIPDNVSLDGDSNTRTPLDRVLETREKKIAAWILSWSQQNRPPRMAII